MNWFQKVLMSLGTMTVSFGFMSSVTWISETYFCQHVTITEQDIVRYCLLSRTKGTAEAIDYNCRKLGGDYFIAQGFQPNWDKFPSWQLDGLDHAPTVAEIRAKEGK